MAFVKSIIESKYKGSFFQAVIDTLPELSSAGHGKGLAAAILDLPLSAQEVKEIADKLTPPVSLGFVHAYGTHAMRKVGHRDARLAPKLAK